MSKKIILALGIIFAGSNIASAQAIIGPSTVMFLHPDSDFNITASYMVDFFLCNTVTAGTCQSKATLPVKSISVPKASVISFTPNTLGENRSIDLKAVPVSTVIPSLPVGMPLVITLTAIGDPNVGGIGASAASAISLPFYSAGKIPAVPTLIIVK